MHPYVQALQSELQQHANPDEAGPSMRYMRNQFPFLGIKSPARKLLLQRFVTRHGLPPLAELETILPGLVDLISRRRPQPLPALRPGADAHRARVWAVAGMA